MTVLEKFTKYGALLLFIALLIAMFMPSYGNGEPPSRSSQEFSATGHMLIFFLAAYLFYAFKPEFANRSFRTQVLSVLAASFIASCLIESIQYFIPGRFASVKDIADNMAGAMVFLSFKNLRPLRRHLLFHVSVAAITLLLLWPLGRAYLDEQIAERQFPLLAGFETPFEHTRFVEAGGKFAVSDDYAFEGERSLKLKLTTKTFSGLSLDYMPGNWEGYSYLHVAVYNPQSEPVEFNIRVHDIHHPEHRRAHSDRYNQKFILPPRQWEKILIFLDDIKNAPQTRKMNMLKISNIGLYVSRESKPLVLYIDDIRLKQDANKTAFKMNS